MPSRRIAPDPNPSVSLLLAQFKPTKIEKKKTLQGCGERSGAKAHVELLGLVFRDDREPADDRLALVVGEGHRLLVGDPQMDSAAARVHPQQVGVAELVPYGGVEDAHGSRNEGPATLADVRVGALGRSRSCRCRTRARGKRAKEGEGGNLHDNKPVFAVHIQLQVAIPAQDFLLGKNVQFEGGKPTQTLRVHEANTYFRVDDDLDGRSRGTQDRPLAGVKTTQQQKSPWTLSAAPKSWDQVCPPSFERATCVLVENLFQKGNICEKEEKRTNHQFRSGQYC
ncbi:hypothetical protein B0H14DRAFT_2603118 [Mycena olivaceomarginata]|nr:hypothetical protein B0H14DRAFT_2603118 [Mycena olivaceomarginata]